jgi:hypothetical protein
LKRILDALEYERRSGDAQENLAPLFEVESLYDRLGKIYRELLPDIRLDSQGQSILPETKRNARLLSLALETSFPSGSTDQEPVG